MGRTSSLWPSAELKALRRNMQIVFQDPYSSLDPRMPVGEIIGEGLMIHGVARPGRARRDRQAQMLLKRGPAIPTRPPLPARVLRRPAPAHRHRPRPGPAPEFIVCDEPVSALDVSIQSQVLNLLKKLQAEFGLTYLFIAHNLSVVEHISDRIGVMYLGKMVEVDEPRRSVPQPAASLHPGAAVGDPHAESQTQARADRADGRRALAPQPAQRLSFPPALSAGDGHLQADRPAFEQKHTDHWVACHLVPASGVRQ